MPAPTDLTWAQLARATDTVFIQQMNFSPDPTAPNPDLRFIIDIGELTGKSVRDINDGGVVLVLSRLLDIARKAQEKLNEGKLAGERLVAFPTPTTGAAANGFVPVTRSIASRADLGSVTSIIGATA